jgi:hypothetical protein
MIFLKYIYNELTLNIVLILYSMNNNNIQYIDEYLTSCNLNTI